MSTELKLGAIVTLKPLEWTYAKNQYGDESYSAPTVFCELSVRKSEDSTQWYFQYCVDEYYDDGYEHVDSPEDGKARAEEWYLSRIEGALDRRTDPVRDELVAALDTIANKPIGKADASDREILDGIVEIARAALAKVEGGA